MNTIQTRQQGASTIVVIIILAILGAGGYIGLQYAPQFIEAGTVDAMLENIDAAHTSTKFKSVKAIQDAIGKQLQINTEEDLANNFKVKDTGRNYVIQVSYERELNLLYEKKMMPYNKSLTLKR